jgi:hypothetical protein
MQVCGSGPSSLETDTLEFLHKTLTESQVATNPSTPVQYQQIMPPPGREQPMETQQSHYLASNAASFQGQQQQQTTASHEPVTFSSFQTSVPQSFVSHSDGTFHSELITSSSYSYSASGQPILGTADPATTGAVSDLLNEANGAGFHQPYNTLAPQSVPQQQQTGGFASQTAVTPSVTPSSDVVTHDAFISSAVGHGQASAPQQQAYMSQASTNSVPGPFQVAANSFQQSTQGVGPSHAQVPFSPQASQAPAPGIPTNMVRSPSASLQDSNQTNATLSLLSTVLQQIQALLPQAQASSQQSPAPTPIPSVVGDNPEMLGRLLQSSQGASQVLQMLQTGVQQVTPQAVQPQPVHPQQQQQMAPPVDQQQPNFLLQQNNQQKLLIMSQQQQQQQQPQVHPPQQQQQQHHTVLGAGSQQPVATGMTLSMMTSLASNLGSLGVTIGTDGQIVLGQQPIKLLLQQPGVATSATGVTVAQVAGTVASLPVTSASAFPGKCVCVFFSSQS